MSTRWEIPAQVFPPESFGPCAIAGVKSTAVNKARVAPVSNRVFISVLRMCQRKFEPSDSAAMVQRSAASPFDQGSADRPPPRVEEFRETTIDAKT